MQEQQSDYLGSPNNIRYEQSVAILDIVSEADFADEQGFTNV